MFKKSAAKSRPRSRLAREGDEDHSRIHQNQVQESTGCDGGRLSASHEKIVLRTRHRTTTKRIMQMGCSLMNNSQLMVLCNYQYVYIVSVVVGCYDPLLDGRQVPATHTHIPRSCLKVQRLHLSFWLG